MSFPWKWKFHGCQALKIRGQIWEQKGIGQNKSFTYFKENSLKTDLEKEIPFRMNYRKVQLKIPERLEKSVYTNSPQGSEKF